MNPELQRNLWLEATPRRVAWAGVALALIFGATTIIAGAVAGNIDEGNVDTSTVVLKALGGVGLIVFLVSGLLWASREAGQSVLAEIGQRTWDFQRLSALSPWSMTWGKLFGATSLAWFAALVGVIFAAVGLGEGPGDALYFILSGLGAAVLFQAAAMAAALIGVRKARAEGRLATFRGVAGGVIGLLIVLWIAAATVSAVTGGGGNPLAFVTSDEPVSWWGMTTPRDLFLAIAFPIFALWVVGGAWRLMRLELQMQNTPWWWTAFLVFTAFYMAGFASGFVGSAAAGFGFLVLATYAAAFAEPADRVRLRQFAGSIRGRFGRALELMPAPVPALALAVLGAIVVTVAMATSPVEVSGPVGEGGEAVRNLMTSPLPAWALLAFLVRDLGVIAYFRFGARPRRGDFGAVLALAILYLVFGGVTAALGDSVGGSLFFTNPEFPLISLISAAVQAAFIWWFAARRIAAPEQRALVRGPAAAAAA